MQGIKNAVVTGPTGTIGLALVKKLIAKNVEIYAICRPNSDRANVLPVSPLLHKVDCDLTEIVHISSLVNKKCDAFFHLAWMGTRNRDNRMDMHLQEKNVALALNSVDVANELDCDVYIGAGSQAEYGPIDGMIHPNSPANPVVGYGIAKLCAGQMTRCLCKQYGIRHIWPRIVSIYGEGDGNQTLINTVINSLLVGKEPQLTAGEQLWDYLYSGDAAEALFRMALHGKDGAVYVLGSGQAKPLRVYMETIRDMINPMAPLGIGKRPYLDNQVMHLEADIANLVEDTGWRPKVSFEEGIQYVIKHMRGQA